jgi:septal ring factor EnvC (AmiA/AmiB activator)
MNTCAARDCPVNLPLIDRRIAAVENAVDSIAESMREIAKSTTQLAVLEMRHAETRDALARAFADIKQLQVEHDSIEARMHGIESTLPQLLEMRAAINRALWGLASLVATAVVGLVLIK